MSEMLNINQDYTDHFSDASAAPSHQYNLRTHQPRSNDILRVTHLAFDIKQMCRVHRGRQAVL